MDDKRIEKEMRELETKINYHFIDVSWLAKAMGSIKIELVGQGKNASEYENEGLATVGDAILKSVIVDYLYITKGIKTKGGITLAKKDLESNTTMHSLMIGEGWINYSYNKNHFYKDDNIPEHEKVVNKGHDPYVEAIIGAIYYDSNYTCTRCWILNFLLPILKKYNY